MKLNLNLKRKFQQFCLILVCLVVLIFQSDIPDLKALTMDNYQGEMVIEELRLKVPADVKVCLLYTSPSPRDSLSSRMPSSA